MALALVACASGGDPTGGENPTVTAVTLSSTALRIDGFGNEKTLHATISPAGAPATVAWSSDDPAVAVVAASGTSATVRAVGAGTTRVNAKAGAITSSSTVTVVAIARNVTVASAGNVTQLQVGSMLQLTASVTGDPGISTTVEWSSGSQSVATVSSTGVVTAVAAGTATITARSSTTSMVAGSITLTVVAVPRVNSVTIISPPDKLFTGQSADLVATVDADAGLSTTVQWKSSAIDVATVNSTGHVIAVGPGTATITATSIADPTVSANATIDVLTPTVRAVAITAPGPFFPGRVVTASVVIDADPGANTSLAWSSSNPGVASVSQAGVVTAVALGTATVTATSVAFPSVRGDAIIVVGPPPPLSVFTTSTFGAGPRLAGAAAGRLEPALVRSVWSLNANEAWAAATDNDGLSTALLHYSNGMWRNVALPLPDSKPHSIDGIGNTAWMYASPGGLYRLRNGTIDLNLPTATQQENGLVSVVAPERLFLAVVNDLYRAFDGVVTSTSTGVAGGRLSGIAGITSDDAFALGSAMLTPFAQRWNGTTWTDMAVPSGTATRRLWARSGTEVYAAIASSVYRYDGSAWSEVATDMIASESPTSFAGCNAETYLFTNHGRVFRLVANKFVVLYDATVHGAGPTISGHCATDGTLRIAGNDGFVARLQGANVTVENWTPFLRAVKVVSPQLAYAAGGAGVILRYNGVTWQLSYVGRTTAPNLTTVSSIWASDDDALVLAVGFQNGVLRRSNGNWTVDNVFPARFQRVCGISSTMAFATGQTLDGSLQTGTGIWRFNGSTWIQTNFTGANAIACAAQNFVVAVGSGGTIQHWNGANWQLMPSGTATSLTRVYASSSEFAIATGNVATTMLRWNGTAWSPFPGTSALPMATRINDVFGTGPNEVYVLFEGGQLFSWNGAVWTQVPGYSMTNGIAGSAIPGFGVIVGRAGELVIAKP